MVETINFIVKDKSFEKFAMMMILGTTGDAMDVKMNFFFTFWGLFLLKKKFKPKVAGMPAPMKGMAAKMFLKKLKKFGIEDPWGMIKEAVDNRSMRLFPCQMTMDLMGIKREQLFDFVEDPVGAASFLEMSEGGRIVSL
ncbi:MAG: DsrE/DsrF/DrsH-like family protein [Candidatus Lokiarchaeota archaeon]|nr:DsrE/DsrF/DrsH-like family protein [Candidatus Lokiarchaeota archaeon]